MDTTIILRPSLEFVNTMANFVKNSEYGILLCNLFLATLLYCGSCSKTAPPMTKTLTSNPPVPKFCHQFAIHKDIAIIGTFSLNPETVLVYNLSTQQQITVLNPPGDKGNEKFGCDSNTNTKIGLTVNDKYILVGAHESTFWGKKDGYVYVYDRNTFEYLYKFGYKDNSEDTEDFFGRCVSIYGDIAVVSAERAQYRLGDDLYTGRAYVIDLSENQAVKVGASLGAGSNDVEFLNPNDYFGHGGTAIHGNTVLVGAPYYGSHGIVYVFQPQLATAENYVDRIWSINTPNYGNHDRVFFGMGLTISPSGNRAAICARRDVVNGLASGAVYLIDMTDFSQKARLIASDAVGDDYFGASVSMTDTHMIVGATARDAAYIYDISEIESSGTFDNTEKIKLVPQSFQTGNGFGRTVWLTEKDVFVYSGFNNGILFRGSLVDLCMLENPCSNSGTCVPNPQGAECMCPSGCHGRRCEYCITNVQTIKRKPGVKPSKQTRECAMHRYNGESGPSYCDSLLE